MSVEAWIIIARSSTLLYSVNAKWSWERARASGSPFPKTLVSYLIGVHDAASSTPAFSLGVSISEHFTFFLPHLLPMMIGMAIVQVARETCTPYTLYVNALF